jgi:apolipoprotein N-acyltransferase
MSFLIVFLAGALSVLAYAPFDQSWLLPLSWGVLYLQLRQPAVRPGRAFLLGWAWGSGALFSGLCWLVVALYRYGGVSGWLSVLLIYLFCTSLALYSGLSAALFARLRTAAGRWQPVLLAACWLSGELLRGQVFPSFPWLEVGYTQTPPSPLAGWAPVLGVYGVGFLLLMSTGWLVEAWFDRAWRARALVLGLLPCLLGAGLRLIEWSHPIGAPLQIALVQTNVAQDEKWQPGRTEQWLRMNLETVRKYPAQLTVLPEASLPLLESELPPGYLDQIGEIARARGGDAVLGVFRQDEAGHIYNSAITRGISPAQHYSKNHLVPFGEFEPWGFGWFFKLADIPMADQTPGGDHQALLLIGGQKIAMNICYEDVFGEELRRALPEASLMLNVSNLAWYGDSHAQPQHLQMSRMRALESGRPQLRATNTGMTAVVAPNGHVDQVLAPFTEGAITTRVQGYEGLTPFIWLGDYPLKVVCGLILLWAIWRTRQARRTVA